MGVPNSRITLISVLPCFDSIFINLPVSKLQTFENAFENISPCGVNGIPLGVLNQQESLPLRASSQGMPASFFYSATDLLTLLFVQQFLHPTCPFKGQRLCSAAATEREKHPFHKRLRLNLRRATVEGWREEGVPKKLNLQGLGGARGALQTGLGHGYGMHC